MKATYNSHAEGVVKTLPADVVTNEEESCNL